MIYMKCDAPKVDEDTQIHTLLQQDQVIMKIGLLARQSEKLGRIGTNMDSAASK